MTKSIESPEDTIAAIATPMGEGGIGVLRLSGKEALGIAEIIFESRRGRPVSTQKNFTARVGHAVSAGPDNKKIRIDEAILLVMRGPKSYTGEDVVEISLHGGSAVLQAALAAAVKAGARLAAPGEFTKRAYLNGRMDLMQAEAVLDLIQAKTNLSRQWASAQLEGVLSAKIRSAKEGLVDILSHLEASIDFPDDFPDTKSRKQMEEGLRQIASGIRALLEGSSLGFLAKRGLRVLLWGRPNVGKSSLMNCLAKSNRVIVTPYPGTTRDVVEEEIQIKGFPVRLYDTAGIQDTEHPIEKEGIGRSKKALLTADLVLYILDSSQEFTEEDENLLKELDGKNKIIILNKSDLPRKIRDVKEHELVAKVSCVSNTGIDELEEKIYRFIMKGRSHISDETVVSSVRQKDLLEKTILAIEESIRTCQGILSPEFIAVDVRLALDNLAQIAGEVATEDVLEAIFSRFCIGK